MRNEARAALTALFIAGASVISSQASAGNCTFGASGEPSLQATFDSLLGTATVNAQTACLNDGSDANWSVTGGQLGQVDIKVELAGNKDTNSFGVYDIVTGTRYQLFEGSDSAGATGDVKVKLSGGKWFLSLMDNQGSDAGVWTTANQVISSGVFGFYLGTTNGFLYSNTAKNADGTDHMYAYGPLDGGLTNPEWTGDYIQAWEDLPGGGDRDYQDFVASLTDITPVPLPAAAWLFGSGLLALLPRLRRRVDACPA